MPASWALSTCKHRSARETTAGAAMWHRRMGTPVLKEPPSPLGAEMNACEKTGVQGQVWSVSGNDTKISNTRIDHRAVIHLTHSSVALLLLRVPGLACAPVIAFKPHNYPGRSMLLPSFERENGGSGRFRNVPKARHLVCSVESLGSISEAQDTHSWSYHWGGLCP